MLKVIQTYIQYLLLSRASGERSRHSADPPPPQPADAAPPAATVAGETADQLLQIQRRTS